MQIGTITGRFWVAKKNVWHEMGVIEKILPLVAIKIMGSYDSAICAGSGLLSCLIGRSLKCNYNSSSHNLSRGNKWPVLMEAVLLHSFGGGI